MNAATSAPMATTATVIGPPIAARPILTRDMAPANDLIEVITVRSVWPNEISLTTPRAA